MTKKSNETLYILRFKDFPLIKIGKSKTLASRINTFRTKYQTDFELKNSTAVGCHSSSKIHALEKELLTNSVEFSLKGELLERFGELDGATEIRYDSCLPLILKLIKYKSELTGEFHIYNSISLERNVQSKLPISLFDENGETDYLPTNLSKILIESVKKQVPECASMDNEEISNYALYEFVKSKKVKLEKYSDSIYSRRKKVHYANQYKNNNWYWQNPNSKLGNFMTNDDEKK
jgi:hypothetical protein